MFNSMGSQKANKRQLRGSFVEGAFQALFRVSWGGSPRKPPHHLWGPETHTSSMIYTSDIRIRASETMSPCALMTWLSVTS